MATKYAESAQTGDIGINYISSVCAKSRLIFRRFDSADIGIDGLIEFVDETREPTGDIVLVQSKSGKSFVNNGKYTVKADKDHFETWSRYTTPVIGIVYNPDADDARWVDITDLLRDEPERKSAGPYTIVCPENQHFVVGNLTQFVQKYKKDLTPRQEPLTTPNLSIRPWAPADAKPTRALLVAIASDYPDFYRWLSEQWQKAGVSKKVVEIDGGIAAYSMWSKKDARNIKLQTFFVSPSFRGTAVGQHLLYHELRTWAKLDSVKRIYVTVSSAKAELTDYFYRFGFRVEGIAANKYERDRGSAELVLTKHVVNKLVKSSAELKELSANISKEIWGIPDIQSTQPMIFGVSADRFAAPVSVHHISIDLDESTSTSEARLRLRGADNAILRQYDDYTLMREFYPLKLLLAGKLYVVVPIYHEYASALFTEASIPLPPTQLQLRLDNVYYCYPRIAAMKRGDFVLFYETQSRGGRGAAFGSAIVRDVKVGRPEVLFREYGDKGIFNLANIEEHSDGTNAKAIHFDIFEPFERIVSLRKIRQILDRESRFQSLSTITRKNFTDIVDEGKGN